VAEWFLPRRNNHLEVHALHAELRTDVSGSGGSVVVHTRPVVEMSFLRGQRWRWGTTVCPAGAPDADGPKAASFAPCVSPAEAIVASEQAVEFARDELASTVRARRAES
jgi:hypothetical protein